MNLRPLSAFFLGILLFGCATPSPSDEIFLADSAAVGPFPPEDFFASVPAAGIVLPHRIDAHYGEESWSADGVLKITPDALTLVAATPVGRLFTLTWRRATGEVELRRGVVFRHQLEEGPASRSYGIAVAQLAGVPAPVVRRARQYLASLEARERARQAAEPDLFADLLHAPEPEPEFPPADDPEAEARTEALRAFAREVADKDLDSLTPRDALAWAYDLASRAKKLI